MSIFLSTTTVLVNIEYFLIISGNFLAKFEFYGGFSQFFFILFLSLGSVLMIFAFEQFSLESLSIGSRGEENGLLYVIGLLCCFLLSNKPFWC